ncbi:hypothetical protein F2P81_026395 [Scophthalmus maximus]|uniref:Uncharacterized protein n=1 Tax=Scophthalmus maximus TaxID=52904 RepID=A0A6A4RQQ6_SCOMX|nr:hypothetical protein F2P81_026395 [Scophthalmus maximus]
MSTVSPDKRRKMETALNQLKKHTVVVADTGDVNASVSTSSGQHALRLRGGFTRTCFKTEEYNELITGYSRYQM